MIIISQYWRYWNNSDTRNVILDTLAQKMLNPGYHMESVRRNILAVWKVSSPNRRSARGKASPSTWVPMRAVGAGGYRDWLGNQIGFTRKGRRVKMTPWIHLKGWGISGAKEGQWMEKEEEERRGGLAEWKPASDHLSQGAASKIIN